jgi:tetratricopeptide (TPR) repeat protein
MFISWLVHTSVDWIHLLPGATAVAMCAAGVLLRPATPNAVRSTPVGGSGRGWTRIVVPALVILALLGVGTLLSRLALSERYETRAQNALAARPEAALQDADRALRIDGDYVSAYYTRAAALARRGDALGAEWALRSALQSEPQNFVTWALLGDLAVRTGDLQAARRRYAAASRLNPRDPGLAKLARDPRPGAGTGAAP